MSTILPHILAVVTKPQGVAVGVLCFCASAATLISWAIKATRIEGRGGDESQRSVETNEGRAE